ncbi:signal transduction histidine kinase [Mycetocola sp. CAN_C7]|uniref:sensor histidine kinase n=1 Tax=Mycetocola sp. CAN_C7 TaxID=2787724 RepID=UPI0018CB74AD
MTTEPKPPHPPVPGWVGDVIAAALIVVAALVPFPNPEFRPGSALAFAVAVAPALLLPLRRRRPVSVLAAIVSLYGIAALGGTLSPGIVLGAAVAMFGVATRSTRRRTFLVAGVSAIAVGLLSLFAAIGDVLDPRAVQFVVTIAFAAAAGDATRSRREYIAAIASEARQRVTEERLRIARDLHDTVAHQISVISLNAGVATSALDSRPEKAREALGTIRAAARSVLGEIGDLLVVLRADDDVRTSAPQPGLGQLDALVERFGETGLTVSIRLEGDIRLVTGASDVVAYRVVQEALTNAHKHGAGHRAHVLVSATDSDIQIVVTNPIPSAVGRARSDMLPSASSGHGLLGLRERVASVRGTVSAGVVGSGYRLAAVLPLSRKKSS